MLVETSRDGNLMYWGPGYEVRKQEPPSSTNGRMAAGTTPTMAASRVWHDLEVSRENRPVSPCLSPFSEFSDNHHHSHLRGRLLPCCKSPHGSACPC